MKKLQLDCLEKCVAKIKLEVAEFDPDVTTTEALDVIRSVAVPLGRAISLVESLRECRLDLQRRIAEKLDDLSPEENLRVRKEIRAAARFEQDN